MEQIDSPQRLGQPELQRLLAAGRDLVSFHEPERVLNRLLEAARELTGARYAALGVLDRDKRELERFVFVGFEGDLRRRIGDLPRGHGILGELIRHPEPLRLSRIGEHPRSYGFPAEHPPMETFLGAPVMIRGEVYGNIYLTEKSGDRQFDERDEELVVVLAEWAAIAIDNARSHATEARRRLELERAMRGLEATVSLSRDLGGEADLERVLELVVKRGRDLVEGETCIVLLARDDGMCVAAGAGNLDSGVVGRVLVDRGDLLAKALEEGGRRGVGPVATLAEIGIDGESTLAVPLRSRGRSLGALVVVDRIGKETSFNPDDQLALASFATSAATAIATARGAEDERMRLTIAAAEQERQRWARELHDETLQDLGALRVLQQSALQLDDEGATRRALSEASGRVEEVIDGLQSLITELRPAALDQLGVGAAIEALADRVRGRSELRVETTIELGSAPGEGPRRFDSAVEATVYRLVQEALTNVVKHAGATQARVTIEADDGALVVAVEDDGRGLDPERPSRGFGLIGMRERVQLAGGELRLGQAELGGTRIWASLSIEPEVRTGD